MAGMHNDHKDKALILWVRRVSMLWKGKKRWEDWTAQELRSEHT